MGTVVFLTLGLQGKKGSDTLDPDFIGMIAHPAAANSPAHVWPTVTAAE